MFFICQQVTKLYKDGKMDENLYNLVCSPSRVVRRYAGYIVNGFRFHTIDRCEKRKTQNSGVMVRGDDNSDKEYYGILKDVFEMCYHGGNCVFVFKCSWFDVEHLGRGYKVDDHGSISVNKKASLKTDEVYVLESQVEQVFYIQHPKSADWNFVIKTQPRDLYDLPSIEIVDQLEIDDIVVDVDAYQQVEVDEAEFHNLSETNDDFFVDSLATNTFMVEKEPTVVKMVRKAMKDLGKVNDDFINDGDIESYEDSSEEEEFDESSSN